jgi:hypothetical protein
MKKLQVLSESGPEAPLPDGLRLLAPGIFPTFSPRSAFGWGTMTTSFMRGSAPTSQARSAEQRTRQLIHRGFTVLNRVARALAQHSRIRQMLLSGPLESIIDALKALALARKRLSAAAQGYLEGLCE